VRVDFFARIDFFTGIDILLGDPFGLHVYRANGIPR
jgi:hypothetical protein